MVKYLLRPWILVLTLVGFALLLVPATALAQAQPPHLFLGGAGAVTEGPNNEPVKSGTITAWIDDKEIISETVTDGAYMMLVEQPSGSNFAGKFVQFTVDGSPTDAKVIWMPGGADELSHKVIAAVPTPVPTATLEPTQTLPPPTATSVPVAVSAAPAQKVNPGFRENPTTRLRPVQDQITAEQDGIIEVFMVNPSVNDVPLSVDIVITVPSGIHVYGDGFACAGTGAGACAGSFSILPGQAKTAVISIKAEKIGSHQVHFSGYWWPGENKDMRQPISLTHPFKVIAPSKDLAEPKQGDTRVTVETNNTKIKIEESQPASDNSAKGNDGSCGLSSGGSIPLGSIGLFLGVGLMGFRGMFGKLF